MKYLLLVISVFLAACGRKNPESTSADIVVFLGVFVVYGIAAIAIVFYKNRKSMWLLIWLWILTVFLGAGYAYHEHLSNLNNYFNH